MDGVLMSKSKSIEEILIFYMGKNTPERQGFIIDNLKVEEDYFLEDTEQNGWGKFKYFRWF